MNLTQKIHDRDNQELQTSLGELSFSNILGKNKNQSGVEVFDIENILNHEIYSAKVESHLYTTTATTTTTTNNNNNNNSNSNNTLVSVKKVYVCCGLTKIPNIICDLKYLSVLNLSNNSLSSLPEGFGNLCNLVTLKLSGNKLSCLPKSLRHSQQLNFLDLSFNKFSEVPDVLYYGLRMLRVLDLSCNEIAKFDDFPGCLNKLVVLGLSDNFFKELPVWIFNSSCQLKFLDISQNQLNFPFEPVYYCSAGATESLQSLNVKNCNLTSESIQILFLFKNLNVLHVGNKKNVNKKLKGRNYMGNLNFEKLNTHIKIKELYLTNVLISTLSSGFDCLKNIEVLDLSDNLLSWLPESFCNLKSLKILFLAANQLLFLPFNIGNLSNLRQIHLQNNKLSSIPNSFYDLDNLEFVDFYNNQIEKLNPCILKKKNLKGIDLGFNCLKFNFCEFNVDVNEAEVLYKHLKNSFRKHFYYTNSRSDVQHTKMDEGLDESPDSDSNSVCTKCSATSPESELPSDFEDSAISITQKTYIDNEDWEERNSCQVEEDEFFDPNEVYKFPQRNNIWNLDFRNNYCPANYHVPSVMKTCIRNFKLALQNDSVEEGQFDSD